MKIKRGIGPTGLENGISLYDITRGVNVLVSQVTVNLSGTHDLIFSSLC